MKSFFIWSVLFFSSAVSATANFSFPVKKIDILYENNLRLRAEIINEKMLFMKVKMDQYEFNLDKKTLEKLIEPDLSTLNVYSGLSRKLVIIYIRFDSFENDSGSINRYEIELRNDSKPNIKIENIKK